MKASAERGIVEFVPNRIVAGLSGVLHTGSRVKLCNACQMAKSSGP